LTNQKPCDIIKIQSRKTEYQKQKEVIKMTVAELIAVLETYPSDMRVVAGSAYDSGYGFASGELDDIFTETSDITGTTYLHLVSSDGEDYIEELTEDE
jgi:hypothetical protein